MTICPLERRKRTAKSAAYAGTLAIAASLAAGCGGGGSMFQGAPTIYPETATLAPGQSETFYAGIVEVDQHKVSEGFRVKEKDGGTFVAADSPINYTPPPVRYIAPSQPGTYHIQYVWDAGTRDEKAATATITVTAATATPP